MNEKTYTLDYTLLNKPTTLLKRLADAEAQVAELQAIITKFLPKLDIPKYLAITGDKK